MTKEDRVVNLREELARLLSDLTPDQASTFEEALLSAAIADTGTHRPDTYRPLEKDLGTNNFIAVRWQDLDLISQAIMAVGGFIQGPTVSLAAAVCVALWFYRRRQVKLSSEDGLLLVTLRQAPAGGWTTNELRQAMPSEFPLDPRDIEVRLDRLRRAADRSGREIALVTCEGSRWRVLDI